jgi:bifunctional UDP-N-acetylglucosamine pyrophosphorylase / glucosamine-1-phosphate N-acetyltransferase
MNKLAVVILAAGEGTRMKSSRPKILHELAGKPLILWVLEQANKINPSKLLMVVGHKREVIQKELAAEKLVFVRQDKQLGSGHALKQAQKYLKNFRGDVIVICGDTPLLKAATLKELYKAHKKHGNAVTVLTANVENPYGYGRIFRIRGSVSKIVEEKDATPEQKRISEINSGVYCFSSPRIWKVLEKIKRLNKKKEYYLTDAIEILARLGNKAGTYSNVKPIEILGVNTRAELAVLNEAARKDVLNKWMLEGVTVIGPNNTYISAEASIGRDTVIYPGTMIEGKTRIGDNCFIGPNCFIKDSILGAEVEVRCSYIYGTRAGNGAKIGPFAHTRPGTVLKPNVRVGNFSEVKNSVISRASKINHLSYIGDSFLGEGVNVGAGTITCNYDGIRKNKTYIGSKSFVGSNVNFVAPVKIGPNTVIAAGSTITDNVPPNSLAIARARQINKKRKR